MASSLFVKAGIMENFSVLLDPFLGIESVNRILAIGTT